MIQSIHSGWSENLPKGYLPTELPNFFETKHSLPEQDGCIWCGNKIVLPRSLHGDYLKLMHNIIRECTK